MFNGLAGVVTGFVAMVSAQAAGVPGKGRVIARSVAAFMTAFYGISPVALAVDLVAGDCLSLWGGPTGVQVVVLPDLAGCATAAALFAATARRGGRRAAKPRRVAAVLVPLCLIVFLPTADLAPGEHTSAQECGFGTDVLDLQLAEVKDFGERAFLCEVRRAEAAGDSRAEDPIEMGYPGAAAEGGMADRELLAEARHRCLRSTSAEGPVRRSSRIDGALPRMCPGMVAMSQFRVLRSSLELLIEDDEDREKCRRFRHRPRAEPVVVHSKPMWTDHGILESYEGSEGAGYLLDDLGDDRLVTAKPGHLVMDVHADHVICVTGEAYARRPPLELAGWDQVVEVGYRSPTGRIRIGDPMYGGADGLPDLAFRGKGDYRVRVHYREPDWENDDRRPQQLLVIVYPGRDSRTLVLRTARGGTRI
ncbi:hypothetical protein [Sinosporangium siamense]|nr:hypothetical protein [Sinosporangium siamense]